VRGAQRHERCAGFTRLSDVAEALRPDQLRLRLAEDSRRSLPALRTLSYLESRLVGFAYELGPGREFGL
jgi:phosphoribosyl-dephospho-CoA transferase